MATSSDDLEKLLLDHLDLEDCRTYLEETESLFNPNVFVISRKKDAERLKRSSTLLKSLQMNPVHFLAIEGVDEPVPPGYEGQSVGERGCLLSHMTLLYLASTHPNGEQFTSIYEDDIVSPLKGSALTEHFKELAEHIATAASQGHDVKLIFQGKCYENCACMEPVSSGLFRASQPLCAHAYMIKNSAAREIIEAGGLQHPLFRGIAVDGGFRDLVKTKQFYAFVFHPALFFQDVITTQSGLRSSADQMGNYIECIMPSAESIVLDAMFSAATTTAATILDNSALFATVAIIIAIIIAIVVYWQLYRRSRIVQSTK